MKPDVTYSNTFSIMIGKNNILWLLVFGLFIMAGCERDPQDEPVPDRMVTVPVPDRMVTVHFTVGSQLKSVGTEEENRITGDIILFGADISGNLQNYTMPLSGGQLSLPGTITTLYAIANPTPALLAANPTTLTTLHNLTGDFSAAPVSPFLMSGKAVVSGSNITISLIRCVAKIELRANSNFQITSVTVNTASKVYVFEPLPWSVPASTRVNHTYTENNPVIYIVEHSKGASSAAKFTVTGRFLDMPAHLEWTKEFTVNSNDENPNIDIKRNTSYVVNVNFNH